MQGLGPERAAKKFVQTQKSRGRIAAPAAQTRRQGNSFLDVQADALADARGLEKQLGGAIGQVARVRRQSGLGAGDFKALAGPAEREPVLHPDGLHDGFQFMKPIGAPAKDVKQQVDLAGGLSFKGCMPAFLPRIACIASWLLSLHDHLGCGHPPSLSVVGGGAVKKRRQHRGAGAVKSGTAFSGFRKPGNGCWARTGQCRLR